MRSTCAPGTRAWAGPAHWCSLAHCLCWALLGRLLLLGLLGLLLLLLLVLLGLLLLLLLLLLALLLYARCIVAQTGEEGALG